MSKQRSSLPNDTLTLEIPPLNVPAVQVWLTWSSPCSWHASGPWFFPLSGISWHLIATLSLPPSLMSAVHHWDALSVPTASVAASIFLFCKLTTASFWIILPLWKQYIYHLRKRDEQNEEK